MNSKADFTEVTECMNFVIICHEIVTIKIKKGAECPFFNNIHFSIFNQLNKLHVSVCFNLERVDTGSQFREIEVIQKFITYDNS